MTAPRVGWRLERLDSVAEVRLGRQRSPKNHSGSNMRPYIRAANVGWSGLLLNDVNTMNFSNDEMKIYGLVPGDILLSEASGSPDEVGKPALWSGEIDNCAFQNTLVRVRSHGPESRYLLHWLRYLALTGAFAKRSRGVGIHHIGRAALAEWIVPVPPQSEQRRIVEILEAHLSRLDAATAQVSSAERRLESWKRQALDRLVRETASGRTTLGALVHRIEAGRSFGGSAPPAAAGGWGIVKVSAMTWGEFRPDENKAVGTDKVDPRYEIRPGDVLISRANTTEYVGAPVFVETTRARLLLSDKSLRIIPAEGIAPRWLATVLAARSSRQQVSRMATGTKDSMRNISQQALLSITVPSATPAQQAHVMDRAALLEGTARRLQSELTDTQERATRLRQSLLSAAFSGRFSDRSRAHPIEELAGV